MENLTIFPRLEELYELYQWKQPEQELRSPWQPPEDLKESLTKTLSTVADTYMARVHPKDDTKNSYEVLFYLGAPSTDADIRMKVYERANAFNETDRETRHWGLGLKLTYGANVERLSEGALLHLDGKNWEFSHRLTPSAHRNKGLFGCVHQALESFLQRRASLQKSTQTMFMNTGQPDVLLYFLRKGYSPQTTADAEKLERVLAADPGLHLAQPQLPIFHNESAEIMDYRADTSVTPYTFEQTKTENGTRKNWMKTQNAFRLTLSKTFVPTTVEDARDTLHKRVRYILEE